MFSCTACLRRFLVGLASDLPGTPRPALRALTISSRPTKTQSANHATIASLRKGHHIRVLRQTLRKTNPVLLKRRHARVGPNKLDVRDAVAREKNRRLLDVQPTNGAAGRDPGEEGEEKGEEDQGPSIPGVKTTKSKTRALVERQVSHLTDPLRLAQAVQSRLKIGDVDGALEIVRVSDQFKIENTVSWNHIVDYLMSYQRAKEALKVYNEMKKRGHRPDAHTYTIMLRGFSQNSKEPQSVQNALGVYNSMFAPNSTTTPNLIHTNAVINVCARARDMDALWSVAGKLPESGKGAPDRWTITTILNAIAAAAKRDANQAASQEPAGQGGAMDREIRASEAAMKVFDAAVADGRKLWGDVVKRWRSGGLAMDEMLVCAMGRLLLQGSQRRDWEDVYRLCEQTMGLARRKDATERKTLNEDQGLRESEAENEAREADHEEDEDHTSQARPNPAYENDNFAAAPRPSIAALAPQASSSSTSPVSLEVSTGYAKPGPNTLSMLLEASIKLRNVAAGKRYWALLTKASSPGESTYNVEPDAGNLTTLLRLLRLSRSSRSAIDLLDEVAQRDQEAAEAGGEEAGALAKAFWRRGTFVMAMSACVRDKRNPHVFQHATLVLDRMQEHLERMDPKVMEMYLRLAVATTAGLVGGEGIWNPNPRTNNLMRAVERLGAHQMNVRRLVKEGVEEQESRGVWARKKKKMGETEMIGRPADEVEDLDALRSFLQALIGAYDRLIAIGCEKGQHSGMSREYVDYCLAQKRKLSAFVTKMLGPSPHPPRRNRDAGGLDEEDVEEDADANLVDDILDPEHADADGKQGQDGRRRGNKKQRRMRSKDSREMERRDELARRFPRRDDVDAFRRAQQWHRQRRGLAEESGLVVKPWGESFREMERQEGGQASTPS